MTAWQRLYGWLTTGWSSAAAPAVPQPAAPQPQPVEAPATAPLPTAPEPYPATPEPPAMAGSEDAIALAAGLVAPFEGFSLEAYLCPTGFWTIGYGSTRIYGRAVRQGDRITNHSVGRAMLMEDLREAAEAVERAVTVPLTSTERAALISIIHNVGPGRADRPGQPGRDGIVTLRSGRPSTLLRLLNAGDRKGAADQFAAWNKGGGVVLKGLVRRRAAEAEMFRRG